MITRRWKKVKYGDDSFRFWSNEVDIEGDEDLSETAPMRSWKKVVLLEASSISGSSKITFSIGFLLPSGQAKISRAIKKIGDGLFAMMLGPGNCSFFIVSNQEDVFLQKIRCMDKTQLHEDEAMKKVVLY